MSDKNTEHMRKYAVFMEEIKRRHHVCEIVLGGIKLRGSLIGYLEADLDLLYLQLRKILELIMFASVVAHRITNTGLRAEAEREYNAGRLVAWIEKINPNFFPVAKEDVGRAADGTRNVRDLDQTAIPTLTKAELKTSYSRACGDFAHAQRAYSYGNQSEKQRHVEFVRGHLNKISALLNHHWVHLTDDVCLAVVMQSKEDGNVHVN